jgi:hypothetical protein
MRFFIMAREIGSNWRPDKEHSTDSDAEHEPSEQRHDL